MQAFRFLKRFSIRVLCLSSAILFGTAVSGQPLVVNDSGYFEKSGVNFFVFSSQYNGMFFDEKTAGVELIHHGVRTATGGAVRLQHTPEQWDLIPTLSNRKVDKASNTIEATLTYKDFDFSSRLVAKAKGNGIEISVFWINPCPKSCKGRQVST